MKKKITITESDIHNIVKVVCGKILEDRTLYHGTRADFNQFDLAYLSSG